MNLYVLNVYLTSGPLSPDFPAKEVSRVIEIRGDQTLDQLHKAIFQAFDRWDEHLYEFQFGKRPFDPGGPNYSIRDSGDPSTRSKDPYHVTVEDAMGQRVRAFGYWFDFGDDWFHTIFVERIETAIPTVAYPRVRRRVGKSPPQYFEEVRAKPSLKGKGQRTRTSRS